MDIYIPEARRYKEKKIPVPILVFLGRTTRMGSSVETVLTSWPQCFHLVSNHASTYIGCKQEKLKSIKVTATSLKLEIRLHAYQVGTNT